MPTSTRDALVRDIDPSEQALRKWEVWVDGELLIAPRSIEIRSAFGVLRYGWVQSGNDGWSFREAAGGGAVSVPYAFQDGELWIGVVEERRPNQGGQVLNVPRGFVDAGETHSDAADRELSEETGLPLAAPRELSGSPLNPNSAFFETPEPTLGVRVFAFEVPGEWLVPGEVGRQLAAHVHASSVEEGRASRLAEGIGKLRFVPWHDATELGDMFTVAAVARLAAALHREGRWRARDAGAPTAPTPACSS